MSSVQKGIRVLVAEDSATQAEELRLILETEGFTVTVAKDGNQALEYFKNSEFDLVLTDVIMPGIYGYDLCRHIKSSEKKRVPVALLTSLSSARDIIEGLACGADNYIIKPYEPDYLIERIKRILNNSYYRSQKTSTDGVEVTFSGEKFQISVQSEQILDFLVSTFEDYSRAKRQEHDTKVAGLKASEAQFRAVVEAAPNGMFMVDRSGKITLMNSQMETLFGYERGELIGEKMDVLIPEKYRSEYPNYASDFFTGPEASYYSAGKDLYGVRKDGVEFPVEIGLNALTTEAGLFILVSIVDITARKEAENRVREFYSTVSHELRTPMSSISGSLSLMEGGRAGELSPRAMHLIQVARSNAERLIRLINDILDLRKIETGNLQLKYEKVEPAQIVEATLEGVRGMTDIEGVHLVSELNIVDKLYCDKDRIIQVLTNLVSNAIKFSPENGQVTVRVEIGAPGMVRFSVTDQGPGIPKDQRQKLFGLFQQLDSPDGRERGGTGLGLAISKAIVQEHQGCIGVDSTAGQGSTFWFELPFPKSELGESANFALGALPK